MLITPTGEMVGTLSGGCVENDLWQYTKQISTEPLLISYDATSDEDLIWGFGLGCQGVVQILLEKLDRQNTLSPLNLIKQCLERKQRSAIATVFAVEGESDIKIGSRLLIYPDSKTISDIVNRELTQAITNDTMIAMNTRQSTVKQYQLSSSRVEVFIDVIQPPTPMIIFGAGRDALPVVESAKAIGWEVTLVDCRAQQATYQRFSLADQIILIRREIIAQQLSIKKNTVAVVMTHNYFDDFEIIKFLLPTKIPYLGVMGSKDRIARIVDELNPPSNQLEKLYSPIGLDIGADTPAEIASAIIAEIQAVLAQRNAGFLKHRSQPLH